MTLRCDSFKRGLECLQLRDSLLGWSGGDCGRPPGSGEAFEQRSHCQHDLRGLHKGLEVSGVQFLDLLPNGFGRGQQNCLV